MARITSDCCSCEPNTRVEKWTVKGEMRLGIFANRDIAKGTEVTIDYQLGNIADLVGKDKMKCSCGAPSCTGFIGVKLPKAAKKAAGAKQKRLLEEKRLLGEKRAAIPHRLSVCVPTL